MDIQLQHRVEALLARYADCLDQGRYEEWPGFFTVDCVYKIISSENFEQGLPLGVIDCDSRAMLEDRITALRTANIFEEHRYRHILSTTLIKGRDGALIRSETSYQVIRIMRDGAAGLFSSGRYLDKIVDHAGELKFSQRLVVFDGKRIDTLLVIPL